MNPGRACPVDFRNHAVGFGQMIRSCGNGNANPHRSHSARLHGPSLFRFAGAEVFGAKQSCVGLSARWKLEQVFHGHFQFLGDPQSHLCVGNVRSRFNSVNSLPDNPDSLCQLRRSQTAAGAYTCDVVLNFCSHVLFHLEDLRRGLCELSYHDIVVIKRRDQALEVGTVVD